MFNKLKFKAVVVENGKTLSEVAEHLDMNTSTLYRKMNGISEFDREEINKICNYLNLDSPIDIFFANSLT